MQTHYAFKIDEQQKNQKFQYYYNNIYYEKMQRPHSIGVKNTIQAVYGFSLPIQQSNAKEINQRNLKQTQSLENHGKIEELQLQKEYKSKLSQSKQSPHLKVLGNLYNDLSSSQGNSSPLKKSDCSSYLDSLVQAEEELKSILCAKSDTKNFSSSVGRYTSS